MPRYTSYTCIEKSFCRCAFCGSAPARGMGDRWVIDRQLCMACARRRGLQVRVLFCDAAAHRSGLGLGLGLGSGSGLGLGLGLGLGQRTAQRDHDGAQLVGHLHLVRVRVRVRVRGLGLGSGSGSGSGLARRTSAPVRAPSPSACPHRCGWAPSPGRTARRLGGVITR
eukprot:scaffold86831_cov42-Phaeocystis_antarctica.AAC.1